MIKEKRAQSKCKFPTLFLSAHTNFFNATCMYFFSISLNVNEQKGKLMHNQSIKSFHKNDDFATIFLQGKEEFTTLSFSKIWGILTLSMKRLIICTHQSIDLSWMKTLRQFNFRRKRWFYDTFFRQRSIDQKINFRL